MTEQQFLALHTTSGGANINTSYTINVNYDDSVPQVPGYVRSLEAGRVPQTIPNYVIGITVTRKARSVDGVQGADVLGILEGLQKVRFTFDGYEYALNILSRAYYPGVNTGGVTRQSPYFYFRVTPFQLPTGAIDDLTDPEFNQNILVNFTPFIEDLEFLFINYNATYNNAQAIRRSYKIVVADRLQTTVVPTNFDAIYDGIAEFAEVQDSLYYDTGWINGRYNGSKTTADNYSGLVPSVAGRSFQGEIFSGNTVYDTFCLLRNDSRVFEELFHTGPRDEPDYSTTPMGIYLDTLLTTNTRTIPFVSASLLTGSIDRGDILLLDNEKIKVRSVDFLSDPPVIIADRGWAGTTDAAHIATTEFIKIDRTDIFRFTNSRTKSSVADNNVVYTEVTNIALHTDAYGTVYSQSICPQTLLLGIDDPNEPSDRRLKTNLTFIGTSPSGLNIYTFEYIDKDKFGEGLYQGVMSDEIPEEAVSIGPDGYDRVNYSLIDVEFKKL